MEISDLPMVDDTDADYSPQRVKLARILRAKISSGDLAQHRAACRRVRASTGCRLTSPWPRWRCSPPTATSTVNRSTVATA